MAGPLDDKVDEFLIGAVVVITNDWKDYEGHTHAAGTYGNLYLGETYGVLGSNEAPVIFNKELPFIGISKEYLTLYRLMKGKSLVHEN